MSGKLIDREVLHTFVIPNALNRENFEELVSKTFVEEVGMAKKFFGVGDNDKKNIYLIEGEVTLMSPTGNTKSISAGTQAATHPIGHFQPRKHNAIAKSACKITRIDSDLLDVLMTWDQMSAIQVDEVGAEGGEESDWMTRILQSKAFLQVPAGNIQSMFMRIEEIDVKAGDVIIKQGSAGDFYYVIKVGRCKVSRLAKSGSTLTLAKLKAGDAFGEEALLSDTKRNANIVMETDGVLMRLAQKDFNELLKEPMLSWVSKTECEQMVKDGAVLIDVRLESEHKESALPNSLNMPLFMLRLKVAKLPENRKYIIYCNTGRRSSAGAFLLSERGLDVSCLKGGLTGSG